MPVPTEQLRWSLFLTGLLLFGGAFLPIWAKWFPGAAVYRGDASFLVRNQAELSFWGTVVTFILTAGLSIYLSRGKRAGEPPATATTAN